MYIAQNCIRWISYIYIGMQYGTLLPNVESLHVIGQSSPCASACRGSGIHTVVFSRRSSSKRSYGDMHTLFQVIIPIGYEYGTEVRYTGAVKGSVDFNLLAHYVNISTVLRYRIFLNMIYLFYLRTVNHNLHWSIYRLYIYYKKMTYTVLSKNMTEGPREIVWWLLYLLYLFKCQQIKRYFKMKQRYHNLWHPPF